MKLTGFITSIFSTQASGRRTAEPVESVRTSNPITINEGETSTQHNMNQRPEAKAEKTERNKEGEQTTANDMRKGGIDIKV